MPVHLEWFLSHKKKKKPSSYAVCRPWTLSIGEPRTLRGNRSCSSWVAPPARLPTQPPAATVPSVAALWQPALMAQMATAASSVAVGSIGGTPWVMPSLGLQWRWLWWVHKAWHHLPEVSGSPAAGPAVLWALLSWEQAVLECAQNQGDMKPYKDFNEVLWQCRTENGLEKKCKLKKWKLAPHNW